MHSLDREFSTTSTINNHDAQQKLNKYIYIFIYILNLNKQMLIFATIA